MKRELIQVSTSIRIENGPLKKTVIAGDGTVGDDFSPKRYKYDKRDVYGKKIVKGEVFTFLDDYNSWGWFVYKLDTEVVEVRKLFVKRKVELPKEGAGWNLIATFSSKQEALDGISE